MKKQLNGVFTLLGLSCLAFSYTYGNHVRMLTMTNKSSCILEYSSRSSQHAKWDQGPETIGPNDSKVMEAETQCGKSEQCDAHSVRMEYVLKCPEGESIYDANVDFTWLLKHDNYPEKEHLETEPNYTNTIKAPDYTFDNNLTFSVTYSDNLHTSWTLTASEPTNSAADLSLGSAGNLQSSSNTSDPSEATGVIHAKAIEILPDGKSATCRTGQDEWWCNNGSSDGIYRINFAYRMVSSAGNFSSAPPVAGSFLIYGVDSTGSETVIGEVKRDYAFLYRNDPAGGNVPGALYLEDSFVYSQTAPMKYQSLKIQGGYYDASGEFHAVGFAGVVDLNTPVTYEVSSDDTNDPIYYTLNDNSSSSTNTADMVNNGMHQIKVAPSFDTSAGAYLPVGSDTTQATDGNIYQHVVDVLITRDAAQNITSSKIITNFVPCEENNGVIQCSQDADFETSYLKSRYYCDLSSGDISQCYGNNSYNLSATENDMSTYPPLESNYLSDSPDYLSMRAGVELQKYSLEVCYAYYDGTQIENSCSSDGTNQQDLILQGVAGSFDGASYDTNKADSNYLMSFAYLGDRIVSDGKNNLDNILTVGENNSTSFLATTNSEVMNKASVCYMDFITHSNLQPISDFQASYVNENVSESENVAPFNNDKDPCGMFNDTLTGVSSLTWVAGQEGYVLSLTDQSNSPYKETISSDSQYVNVSGDASTSYDIDDEMDLLQGWPVWNSWVNQLFPVNEDLPNNNNEAFMLMRDASSATTENSELANYNAYTHFSYSNYSENNLIVPFPAYVALAKDNTAGEVGCSFALGDDKNNISAFVNSWCEYLSPNTAGVVNGNDVAGDNLDSALTNAGIKNVLPSMGDVWIGGVRDVLGDYYPPMEVKYSGS